MHVLPLQLSPAAEGAFTAVRGRVWNAHFEPESGTHAAVLAQAWAMMMAHTVPLFSV